MDANEAYEQERADHFAREEARELEERLAAMEARLAAQDAAIAELQRRLDDLTGALPPIFPPA